MPEPDRLRAYVGGVVHETNAFSPVPTRFDSFRHGTIGYGDLLAAARAAGLEVIAGTSARAAPSAPPPRADYERLRDDLLEELGRAGDLDLVLLSLHGAQVAEGYPDCEGDLVAAVRALVGPGVTIGVLLDLHAAITETLLQQADIVCAIKEYPHTDFPETAAQVVDLSLRLHRGDIQAHCAFVPLPVFTLWHTPEQPARALVDAARDLEAGGEVYHLSLVHGFPWSDVPAAGAAVIAYAGSADTALAHAAAFAARLWDAREADLGHYRDIPACLALAENFDATDGPLVIADSADNPGAGCGGDATWLIEAIADRGIGGVACAMLVDPAALSRISEAGAGATLDLSLGAHSGALAGRPLQGSVEVLRITEPAQIDAMPGYPPHEVDRLALVRWRGVDIVVSAYREQVFGPRVFREVGIEPSEYRVLVVKSSQHFYKAFSAFAGQVVYCDSPAARSIDFSSLPFRARRRPMWPLDDCSAADIPAPRLVE